VGIRLVAAAGSNTTWAAALTDSEGNATFQLVPK
jgi:hypothetical protein